MAKGKDVIQAVEAGIIDELALSTTKEAKEMSQKIIMEEMRLSNEKEYISSAIEAEIADDKAEYKSQLNKIAKSSEKENNGLGVLIGKKASAVRKECKNIINGVVAKEVDLLVKAIKTVKSAVKLKKVDLSRASVSLHDCISDVNGKKKAEHFAWSISVSQNLRYGSSVVLEGEVKITREISALNNKIKESEKKIKKLLSLDESVRVLMHELDAEEADLRRRLNKSALNKSATGSTMLKRVKTMRRSKVKALPLGV